MNKLISAILKLTLAALALAGCILALVHYWDKVMEYAHAGRKLYCHARSRNGKGYSQVTPGDYADLDLEGAPL